MEYTTEADFLVNVRAMAGNVAAACSEYAAKEYAPAITLLRVFPVSCGAFAGDCDKLLVAQAICKGIVDCAVEGNPIAFEFICDAGMDLFAMAWESI